MVKDEFEPLTKEQLDARRAFFIALPNADLQAKFPMAKRVIDTHNDIVVSVSGGADSDCLVDWMVHLDVQKKCRYIFVDTGMEMQSQKKQIQYLQERYGIVIETVKPKVPTAASVIKHGHPFLSKQVSENIERLQKNDFKWEDKPYEVLSEEYPQCKSALKWWCNCKKTEPHKPLRCEIGSVKWLKEFLIENRPTFRISEKCCDSSKKEPAHRVETGSDVVCTGIRRAEGGTRTMAYSSCFVEDTKYGWAQYMPLFFWTDRDKEDYCRAFDIRHSAAYTEYGMKRTGCAGCPYNSKWERDLEILEQYEPTMARVCKKVFAPSYEYSRKFKEFKEEMNRKERLHGQMELEEFI